MSSPGSALSSPWEFIRPPRSSESTGWGCTCVSLLVASNVLHQASDATLGRSELQLAVKALVRFDGPNHILLCLSHLGLRASFTGSMRTPTGTKGA
jgi:hypothetical protein